MAVARVLRGRGAGHGKRGPARRRCHDDRCRRARPAAAAGAVAWMIEYAVLLGAALMLVAVDGALLRASHNFSTLYMVVAIKFWPVSSN